jgi:hypothetical protein
MYLHDGRTIGSGGEKGKHFSARWEEKPKGRQGNKQSK